MNISDKISQFDPNALGDTNNTIYGLPFTCEDANLVIIPVPWDVTVSYSAGTSDGPAAVFDASFQVDLYDPLVEDAWKSGIAMDKINEDVKSKGLNLREKAETYIELLTEGENPADNPEMQSMLDEINLGCREMTQWVKTESLRYLNQNKFVALLGGDHSTPLGLIQALAEKYESFGILHIDAHADLREAYEGFEFSHASIMFNSLKLNQISKLVQAGIRDYCQDEVNLIQSDIRIKTFFDRDLKHQLYEGKTWSDLSAEIISHLPHHVYLSIDIDGMDPKLCPNTGTPVPGGFEYEQLIYLIEKLAQSQRQIIGFDLNEIAPGTDEWDANVGARILYRLANLSILSNQPSS
jgi:agmatinase